MEHKDDDIGSLDEDSLVLNNDCSSERRSDELNIEYDEDNEDTRSELKFDKACETEEESEKRALIEEKLGDKNITLQTWQNLAISRYGLVAGIFFHYLNSHKIVKYLKLKFPFHN
ncbi:unnamed protein product [Acanthoscelides obtectus]|uniref:Uncharacterized protein n=1 Tax=Acanthoscelides obtectus TaxID=200917 RepID=A0A9P0NPP1_ACAOB|nr:unnamed protein product [Acanthoscelides obtectus]CAK1650007.1 hypothetical protein AOBTE_LOCUS16536 [Acanthoscelides obtectus]